MALDPKYQAFHQSKVVGPKLSGCLPVRSSWTQVIRIFTSQKWQDPSYQAAYQLEVALDPKYQAFHQSKVAGPKLSGCLPVRSSWTQVIRIFTSQTWRTQVIRIFTSQKWQDPSYQAAYQLEVAGPKLSGSSPVKSGRTQVIRLLTS